MLGKEVYVEALKRIIKGQFVQDDYHLLFELIDECEFMKRKIYGLENTVQNQKRQIDKFTKASYKGYDS